MAQLVNFFFWESYSSLSLLSSSDSDSVSMGAPPLPLVCAQEVMQYEASGQERWQSDLEVATLSNLAVNDEDSWGSSDGGSSEQ